MCSLLDKYVNFSSHQKWTNEVTPSRHTYENTHGRMAPATKTKKKLSFSWKPSRNKSPLKHLSSLLDILVRFSVPLALFCSYCKHNWRLNEFPTRRSVYFFHESLSLVIPRNVYVHGKRNKTRFWLCHQFRNRSLRPVMSVSLRSVLLCPAASDMNGCNSAWSEMTLFTSSTAT